MADVKKIRELSGWLTYELDTKLLDPHVLFGQQDIFIHRQKIISDKPKKIKNIS